MNFRSFEKTDRRILSIAIILLVLSTLLLWQDGWIYRVVQTKHFNAEKIGEVASLENDVRRRFEVALSWLPLRSKTDIYQGDSIFTGNKSTVIIETVSGEKISISPNSLVVINRKKDSISLDIGFGSVESRVQNGKKLFITSNNNLTEIAGSNAAIKVDAGDGSKLLLNVLAGEVRVRADGGDKILRGTDAAEILNTGKVFDASKPTIELISPTAEQKFKISDELPVVFKWQTKRKFTRMKIKISTNPQFLSNVVDTRVDENFFSAYNLPKDVDLYWQIIAEGGVSTVSKFAVVGDRPPIPVFPKPGYQFYFDPELPAAQAGSTVDFTWEPGSPSAHYTLQVARNSTFTEQLIEKKIKTTQFHSEILLTGQYYWRVRSIDFPNLSWSTPSLFKIGPERTRILAPPLPQMANNTFLIPTKIHKSNAEQIHALNASGAQKFIDKRPRINWSGVSGADKYLIEISKTKSFLNKLVSQTVPNTHYNWQFVQPGQYYWRIKGIGETSKDGLYSNVQQLNVAIEPPIALSQSLIVDEVPDQELLKAPPPPITISWNPTVFSKSYEVEFSYTSDFKNPTQFITSASSRVLQIASPGLYFWRVRSLDENKIPVSPFSSAYTLEFQRVYKDPAKSNNLLAIYPQQQDSIILVGAEISELEFKWTRPFTEAAYRIELSYEPNFESVFFSASTKENFYKFTEKFKSGVVYWRVRAEHKDFTSDWTGGNRFLVSYENRPFSFEQSDLIFAARLDSQQKQIDTLNAQKRRLAKLRSPTATLELQLDTPQLINPPNQFTIESNLNLAVGLNNLAKQQFDQFYSQVRGYPTIRWNKVPAAERYVIEIATDANFTQTVSKTPTWDPFYSWDTVRPGQFYYRVQAFNDRYKRSYFSPPQELQVVVESPIATSPDTVVEVHSDPREMWPPPSPFQLTWRPVVFARGYEVEFSRDKTFSLAKVYATKVPSTEIKVTHPGLYFWRVRPISEHGIGIASFSPIRSVEVIQTNRNPASVTTLTAVFPIERTMLFVGDGLMNLAFHWISPNSENTTKLEISNSVNFENIITSATSTTSKAIISKDLPEGKLFWRVRSGDVTSIINEFYLRRERAPYVSEIKADLSH